MQQALLDLKQKDEVVEYFLTFDQLQEKAGYTSSDFDSFLLNMVSVVIDSNIAKAIVMRTSPIMSYEKYKELACQLD